MAARVEEERERTTPTRASTTNVAPAQGGSSETTEISLTQMRAKFPWLVSVAQGG